MSLVSEHPTQADDASSPLNLVKTAQDALDCYELDPGSAEKREVVQSATRAVAARAAALAKRENAHPLVAATLPLIASLNRSGLHDYALSDADRAMVSDGRKASWPATLAMMTLGSAWQWGEVPGIEATPQWMWAEYTAWLFAAPRGFTKVGDANRYAGFVVRHLEDLARLVERNLGSAAVRAAGTAYLKSASGIPLYFSEGCLRRHAELRGKILKRLLGREVTPFQPLAFSRDGRRLRVGFLNRHFDSQTETYTTLPTFEQLDSERFEVILFALREADTPLATYCKSKVQEYRVLPGDLEGQLSVLRDANLDVLVFGANVTASVHEVTQLALYRIAPLQVANNSSCITTGFPEIDLYVSGSLTEVADAAEQFSERLGLLPGPAHAFNYSADKEEPRATWTRATLGVPDDVVLFATAANYFKIIPEMQHAWARLLAAVPNSRLLVHPFNPNWSSTYPIQRFCAEFDRVLAEHGVATDRLMISTEKFPSRSEVGQLLRIADVYLDTYPFGGAHSLADPLEAGIPVVAWEGTTFRSRMGGSLLRSLDLPELIVTNEADYLRLAGELATDAGRRTALSGRIREKMEASPIFLDTLAASDAFGALITAAFDELLATSPEGFRKEKSIISVSVESDVAAATASAAHLLEVGLGNEAEDQVRRLLGAHPANPELRRLMGRILTNSNRYARAAEYLLEAVQNATPSAAMWQELARALEASGNIDGALTALQTAIKIDPKNAEGWFYLGDIAHRCGHAEMLTDIVKILEQLAPDDPRLPALRVYDPVA
ncbi:tetratricopeptide repeat protein [Opitutus sp. ER46]|uniref:tetratricopeptide repeat protein n=1 Tax=Opitutus sp. ER46 TaxID=2161864 RepID=UPI001304A2BD|nr:tetratricopeptide repeat protein [Opitutus sp. ER46]